MLKVSLRSLLSHKLRLALTATAIVLGVTFVAGTLILTDTIRNTFQGVLSNVDRGVAVEVRGRPLVGETSSYLPVPTSLLATIRAVSGVQDAVGLVSTRGIALIENGKVITGRVGVATLGGNWIADQQLSPYRLASGSPPQAADDMVIDQATATRQHLAVGDQVEVSFKGGPAQSFRISGIAEFGNQTSVAGASFALFTEPTAETLLQAGGTYNAIDASVQSGVTALQLRTRISSALSGDAVTVQTGQQAASQAEQTAVTTINNFVGTPLLVFALIAVFVGSFLIVNTFSILVAQRTQELALLRAVGATRGQVFSEVVTEAAITGVVASLLGFVLGLLVARVLVRIFSSTATLSVGADALIWSLVIGTVVTVVAAAFPARRATHIPPVAALREAVPETHDLPRGRIAAGSLVLAAGVAGLLGTLFTANVNTGPNLAILGLSVLAIFLGMALLAPGLVRPVAAVLGWPARRLRGAPGRLAGENARRNPRRTALTASALMIGLALVTAVAVLTESVEASIDAAIDGSVRAQLVVLDQRGGGGFTPDIASTLRQDPRLTDIAELRSSDVLVGNVSTSLLALDPSQLSRVLDLSMTTGSAASIATQNTAVVDSTTAAADGLQLGSRVAMTFPRGDRINAVVGGIYSPDALINGYLVSLATLAPHVVSQQDDAVLVNPASGVSLSTAQASLLHDLQSFPVLTAMTKAEYKDLVSTGLNSFLNLIYVLLGLAIIIAVVGIINTLALSVLERTREIGLLRALGMTRTQTREMVAWESVIIALLGAVLGLGVGAGMGIALVVSLHADGISQTSVPGGNLIIYACAAGLFGILAAIFPAIRASRVDVLRAITIE
ncbi:MAG TPA: FtsX-like permease family protein [Candidatus Binatia bacterium]|nr:FtsX-like permease family protein [Candidatus Binatia bacterium]